MPFLILPPSLPPPLLPSSPHLVLRDLAVATMHNVLLDVVQLDGGRQLPPFLALLPGAAHPHREVLVGEEDLRTRGNPIASFPLPHLRPVRVDAVPRLAAVRVGRM